MDRILRTGWSSNYIHVPSIANKLDEIVGWINAHDEPSGTAELVWSSEVPTVAGWYWYRGILPDRVCWLYGAHDPLCVSGVEYAGPILPPAEPRHEGEAIG